MDATLVSIWHPTKNLPLVPDDVAIQSNKKLWWKREKGHEWQSDPSHLYKLTPSKRCPYCDVRAVCADNSLLTKYPELAREWDNELNFPLTPDQVLYCSEKKYWWRRGEFVWQASVKDLLRKGEGIPPQPVSQLLSAPAAVCHSSGFGRSVGQLEKCAADAGSGNGTFQERGLVAL
ncbi:zinc-ribbon domain-containing protein [Intestinimonas sp. HCP28S3_D6]|uniref:zinc-ribbon domain-containing protein n=1 Tax=Intestinimonas sp. HCP28S3_D6 TaxID=3438942 RepID=UPI003F888C16